MIQITTLARSQLQRFLSLFFLVLILDQVTKNWAVQRGDFSLNSGVSLGILAGVPSWLLTVLLVAFIGFSAWCWQSFWRARPVLAGAFFGAASSNIFDRVRSGAVVDWIHVPGLKIQNNIADWVIVGVLVTVLLAQVQHDQKHWSHLWRSRSGRNQ